MSVMGLCIVYVVDDFKFDCWGLIYVYIVFICLLHRFQMIGMNWSVIWVCLLVLACINSVGVCNSRSSKPGSPGRDYQRLEHCLCSSVSLRRRILVLGDKPSRLGECASHKRELVSVGWFCLGISPRHEALFWAKKCLAQARVPRLSENSKNDLMFCLIRCLGERFEFWEKGGLA